MSRKKKIVNQESLDWWNKKIKGYVPKGIDPVEYKKMNRRKIGVGSMVTFKYPNPKTDISILKWFDAHPIIFIFNKRGQYLHGINLHWAPKKFREVIVSFVIKINKMNVKKDRRFDLSWEMIHEFLRRNGLAHIITKQYIIPRIQDMTYIPPQEYKYAINLPSEQFVLDGKYTQDELMKLIYSHTKKTRKSKNKRYGR